jgi:amidophosphoribosyltransferase
MQHRGQDSSGISSYNGSRLHIHKARGLVTNVYSEESLNELKGQSAIGHNRYSTSGGDDSFLNQPLVNDGLGFAFAHNGNLPYTDKLREYTAKNNLIVNGHNDSGLMALALSNELKKNGGSIEKAVRTSWPLFTGAFCCVGLLHRTVFAFRDQNGIRPLSLGKTDHGYVIASETAALEIIHAEYVRDVKPGELIIIDENGLRSIQMAEGKETLDAFEFVYLARPDSKLAGKSIYMTRFKSGELLAEASPAKADVVMSAPDSGTPAAMGYAKASGLTFVNGLIKNPYIGRTFIEPEKIRRSSVELKFNVIEEVIKDKRIVLIDDSIVRGNTLRHIIKLLRDKGAKEIHVRIASPPVKYPDFYGIDTPSGNGLIAHEYSEDEIRNRIDADSLSYLSVEDLVSSIGLPRKRLCLSSFTGEYPIPVPYEESTTKELEEALT